MIDTHAHLQEYEMIDEVISNANQAGVEKIVCVGYDLQSSKQAVELSEKYDCVYAIVGIHPSELQNLENDYLFEIEKLASHNKVVAIGEIGLDYHYDGFNKEEQKKVFLEQIKLSHKLNLPICIHSRDATGDLIEILKDNQKYLCDGGILHCFSESFETYEIVKKMGFKISIGGVLTYKNAKNVREVISKIPLQDIVIETDSPWLTPTPFRGVTNEPKYLPYVLEELSNIKSTNMKEVEKIVTDNSYLIYKKLKG